MNKANYRAGYEAGYLDAKYLERTSRIALTSTLPDYASGYKAGQLKAIIEYIDYILRPRGYSWMTYAQWRAHLKKEDKEYKKSRRNPRPPKAWFTKMYRGVASRYKRLGKARLSAITASIWWKLPEATRKKLIREYDNPGKAWHKEQFNWATTMREGSPDPRYWEGRKDAEGIALAKYPKRNPTRQHAKKGTGFLGLAAIAGLAYLIWKNRT